ncbi:MAG: lysophospholipid acyltransferase family protein [Desulfobacterales bacterium]|nr:lysophospholipid acyltransferase family protein [Desulfobacterales bacterium]
MPTFVHVLPSNRLRNWRQRLRSQLSLSKFLQLRFNLFLLSIWPISFTKAYIWILARLYFMCCPGKTNTILRNIGRALKERQSSEINKIYKGVIRGIIHHYQEKMLNGFFETPKLRKFLISRVCFDGFERVLQDALKEGRGVIIATGHYGALEYLPRYLAIRKYPTVTMVKFKTERLKKILIPRAIEDGLGVIVPGDVTNVMHEATKVLTQKKIFVTQCDESEEWRPDPNYTMEFLGRKTHPDRMLTVLCKRTRAVLLFGLLHREGKNKYKLFLHRVPDEGDAPISVRTLKLLEKYIYRYPDQWYEWKKYDRFPCAS